MEATSSRTGRPSGSSDISSDAWLCVGLRIIRKHKKSFTIKFILAGLSEWSTQAFHFMKPFLAMRKGGDSDLPRPCFLPPQTQSLTLKRYAFGGIQPVFPCFFAPADAVSDPKKVRILGNPTRFSLFFEREKGEGEQFVR